MLRLYQSGTRFPAREGGKETRFRFRALDSARHVKIVTDRIEPKSISATGNHGHFRSGSLPQRLQLDPAEEYFRAFRLKLYLTAGVR
jgi:hypothetical protein